MASNRAGGHAAVSHDSITGLAHDWSRIGDPGIAPRPPFKVYLPRDTADLVRAVAETRRLGQRLTLRGSGHSSNDLVLADRGNLLYLQDMNRILAVDRDTPSVTVQAGASLIEVDRRLAGHGLGLPVVGDHRHITAGGFASVGGVSPASHRYGLFADNIKEIEYVTFDGEVAVCGRDQDPAQFRRLLTGCGRHGVIAALKLDALRIDKRREWLVNDRRVLRDLDSFIEHAQHEMSDPESARMQRGYWIDMQLNLGSLRFGQWSSYKSAEATPARRLRRAFSQTTRGALGEGMSKLPDLAGKAAKIAGVTAVVFAPPYQTLQDAETLADLVLDYTVGDPTRWFAAWAPMSNYAALFHRLNDLFVRYREETGCFTFVAVLTQAIRSPYLGEDTYGAVMMICGVRPEKLTGEVLGRLVEEMDDICVEENSLRYLHSPTTKDAKKLRLLDPNLRAEEPPHSC